MELDYILTGGGLQNGLMALAILHCAPGARVALVEREERLGGNHTWSFHAGDVPPGAGAWVDPLVAHRWDRYEVAFPRRRRTLEHAYATITAERLDRVVREKLTAAAGCQLLTKTLARRVDKNEVELEGGKVLGARTVIDARGRGTASTPAGSGYQKFLGLEVCLSRPWALAHPLLMDATVEQQDGYRFMYVLPYADDHVLVEDTHFSDGPELNHHALRARIGVYLQKHATGISRVVREETGVLPLPWEGLLPRARDAGPLVAGYQGGWFHPATGYAFPAAVRLAEMVSRHAPNPPASSTLDDLCKQLSRQARFARRLNRMLFGWVRPKNRWKIFERFYRLPADTIRRFYAMQTTRLDRARILVDRPPFAPWLRIPGSAPEEPAA